MAGQRTSGSVPFRCSTTRCASSRFSPLCHSTAHRFRLQVIETESYINELLGEPKEKETLAGLLLNANNVIQLQLGRIDVRFQKPFSLKGWLEEQTSKRAKAAPTIKRKEQAVLLRALGYQVLSDINRCSVVMPAGLVGAVLLTIRGR